MSDTAKEIAKRETNYGGRNPEYLTEEEKQYYESPTGIQRDRALSQDLKSAFKKDMQEIKKKVKKKIKKVRSYFSKDKPYTNKPRPANAEPEKLKKYKVYIPPKP